MLADRQADMEKLIGAILQLVPKAPKNRLYVFFKILFIK
jgi:hypothetical protein